MLGVQSDRVERVKSRIVCENEIELLHFSYATFFSALGSSSLTSRYCL